MSYLLEVLGRGLLGSLNGAFRLIKEDDEDVPTSELIDEALKRPNAIEPGMALGIRMLRMEQYSRAAAVFNRLIQANTTTAKSPINR